MGFLAELPNMEQLADIAGVNVAEHTKLRKFTEPQIARVNLLKVPASELAELRGFSKLSYALQDLTGGQRNMKTMPKTLLIGDIDGCVLKDKEGIYDTDHPWLNLIEKSSYLLPTLMPGLLPEFIDWKALALMKTAIYTKNLAVQAVSVTTSLLPRHAALKSMLAKYRIPLQTGLPRHLNQDLQTKEDSKQFNSFYVSLTHLAGGLLSNSVFLGAQLPMRLALCFDVFPRIKGFAPSQLNEGMFMATTHNELVYRGVPLEGQDVMYAINPAFPDSGVKFDPQTWAFNPL